MRRQRGLFGLMGLVALVALGVTAQPVAAKVTTEQGASILIFPKVIANGVRDTIIQITNTGNPTARAHCFYVNGAPTIPGLPVGPNNPPLWTEIDFDIWLTKQQPTHWVVSTGRLDDGTNASCRAVPCDPNTSGTENADCCDAGFPPGRVPPVVPDFTGELKCIEVNIDTGEPQSNNKLTGHATLVDPLTGDVSKYNAIGIKGNDNNNGDNVLCLGGGVTLECPRGAEYDACPHTWLLDHPAVGAPSPVVDQQPYCEAPPCSAVGVNLTVVPCTENFETQNPPPVTMQFVIINEYEQALSASTTFRCWESYELEKISNAFLASTIGGVTLQTRMRTFAAAPNQGVIGGGVVAVLEETHVQCPAGSGCYTGTPTIVSRAAANGHSTFRDQTVHDLITIPADQLVP
ncbi:hypothetical protein L6Q96_18575 [Candidatus Binatia bacterium]|nr:hypothetical protein [Candidatus Binatia bacterium]